MRKANLEGKKCSIHDVKMTCWLQLEEFKSSCFPKMVLQTQEHSLKYLLLRNSLVVESTLAFSEISTWSVAARVFGQLVDFWGLYPKYPANHLFQTNSAILGPNWSFHHTSTNLRLPLLQIQPFLFVTSNPFWIYQHVHPKIEHKYQKWCFGKCISFQTMALWLRLVSL